MDSTNALGTLRRRWWVIALLACAGILFGALPAPAKVEEASALTRYSAVHTMLVNSDAFGGLSTSLSPSQVSLLATAGEVPRRVAERLGYQGGPASLASQMAVEFDFETGALTFSTTQDSAEYAVELADTWADVTNSYLVERQDATYQERLVAGSERLVKMEAEVDDLTAKLAFDPEDPILSAQLDAAARKYSTAFEQYQTLSEDPEFLSFTTLQRAEASPLQTVAGGLGAPRSRVTRGLMGLVVGIAVGAGVLVALGFFDRRIRTREQAESVLGMRARVLVPHAKGAKRAEIVVRNDRHDVLSDSYRTLRNVVGFVQNGLEPVDRGRVTVVVSPGPGEGKTTLAANLAAAFVESGQTTIAVNTDFRRPRLAGVVSPGARTQLPFDIDEIETVDPQWMLRETIDPHLALFDLTGMASAGELARATARAIPRLADLADAVVVDTSPVGATAEVLEVVPLADIIVVVSKIGQTNIETAERTAAILRDLTTAPMILVLTGAAGEKATYYEYSDRRRSKHGRRLRNGFRKYDGPERRQTDRNKKGAAKGEQTPVKSQDVKPSVPATAGAASRSDVEPLEE